MFIFVSIIIKKETKKTIHMSKGLKKNKLQIVNELINKLLMDMSYQKISFKNSYCELIKIKIIFKYALINI